MLRFHPGRLGCALTLVIALWPAVAHAEQYHFEYVSLDDAVLPVGFASFSPEGMDNAARVGGETFDDSPLQLPHVSVYEDGTVTVLRPDLAAEAHR